jgi:hypothetical protein
MKDLLDRKELFCRVRTKRGQRKVKKEFCLKAKARKRLICSKFARQRHAWVQHATHARDFWNSGLYFSHWCGGGKSCHTVEYDPFNKSQLTSLDEH